MTFILMYQLMFRDFCSLKAYLTRQSSSEVMLLRFEPIKVTEHLLRYLDD